MPSCLASVALGLKLLGRVALACDDNKGLKAHKFKQNSKMVEIVEKAVDEILGIEDE